MRKGMLCLCMAFFCAWLPLGASSESAAQAPPLGGKAQAWLSQASRHNTSPWGPWYFQGEFLFLERDRPDRQLTAFRGEFDMGLPDVGATTDLLQFDYEPGARITVGRNYGADERLEVTYLDFVDWNESALATDPGGELGGTLFFVDGYETHQLFSSSDLRSIEVNWRWFNAHGPRLACSVLTGFRYVMIDEQFTTQFSTSGELREQLTIVTENDLLGWQLGGETLVRPTERFVVGGKAKAALFLNVGERSHSFFVIDPGDESFTGIGSAHDNDLAAAFDVGLFATFHVLPRVAVRAGYDVLFVSGIALAPEQYGVKTIFGGELDDSGSTIYQGPTASVEVLW